MNRKYVINWAWCGAVALGVALSAGAQQVRVTTTPGGSTVTTTTGAGTVSRTTTTSTSGGNVSVSVQHEAVLDVYEPDASVTVIKTAPPAPREEAIVVETKPDPEAVWVPGYWRWDSAANEYVWVSGVWRRPIPNHTWIVGRYEKAGDGWVYIPGYWSASGAESATGGTVIMRTAPAEPREETRPTSPGAGYEWVPGYWSVENGEYVWTAGRWEKPVQENMTYIPSRWVKVGDQYTLIPGRWDYPSETRVYRVTVE